MINNTHEIERLKKQIWLIQTVTLPKINEKIDTLSGGSGSKFDEITQELTNISSKLEEI